jgi:hypothetical protein
MVKTHGAVLGEKFDKDHCFSAFFGRSFLQVLDDELYSVTTAG